MLIYITYFQRGFLAFMRAAIYSRVSTTDQQTLDMQTDACRNYIKARGWNTTLEILEIASGAKNDRPKRNLIIDAYKKREIDVIVVWKLDRWGRSTVDLMTSLQNMQEVGVAFVSVTEALDFTTSTGKAMAGILAIFANFERDMLKERVKSGIIEARKRGGNHGRPASAQAFSDEIKALNKQGKNHSEIAKILKISRGSVYNILGPSKEIL